MTIIRKFVYATMLALTTLNFEPALASAQEPARGQFTLPHNVHWQNALVPAGDYRFSFESNGALGMLTLTKMSSGRHAGFLFLVSDTDETKSAGVGRLVLEATPEGSYVSTMQLPEFGMTLHFPVPSHTTQKQIAKVGTAPSASSQ
jgi:hypothetical protein